MMSKDKFTKSVLSICDIHPFRFGSFEEFLLELTIQLNASGFKHFIIFREKPVEHVEQLLQNQGAIIKILKPSKSNFVNLVTFSRVIRTIEPEIVHFHFYPVYSAVNMVKLFCNAKLVYTDHMGGRKTESKRKRILRRFYYYFSYKLFDFNIDRIICVSNFVKLKYSLEYGIHSKKLFVVYNGINTTTFKKKLNFEQIKKEYNVEGKFVVSCVSLRPDKGPHYLMHAIPIILNEIPDVQFVFAGEGECKGYITSKINELNLGGKVMVTGKVKDISDLFSVSTIVAVPSTFEEAFCFVIAEAVAVGCPVVAFDSGAIKEVFGNIASVNIIPKKSDILAKSIINMLLNLPDYKILDESSAIIKKNYSVEECVGKYMQVYINLLIHN